MAESPATMRVLIADDHPIVAEGLRRFLSVVDEVEVLATLGSVDALLLALSHTPRVDLVVLDVDFPGMSGAETVRAIRGLGPQIVLFTHQIPDDFVASMIHAGARGFVSKSDPVDQLVAALGAVHAGGEWLAEPVRALLARSGEVPLHAQLTERELAVFHLLAKGRTPKEIGFELDLAPSTVYAHVEKVRMKLRAESAADVARYAERWGLRSSSIPPIR